MPEPFRTTLANQLGLSILETLIILAIIGILGISGLKAIRRDGLQVREVSRIVSADLNRARSEAIRLNTNVALQFSGSSYRLFTDFNRSGNPDRNLDGDPNNTPDIVDPILIDRKIGNDFPLASISTVDLAGSQEIWFDVRGLPRTKAGNYLGGVGKISIRSTKDSSVGLNVTLETQGRIRVVKP